MINYINKYGRIASCILLMIFMVIQMVVVIFTAVDIPFYDEWETVLIINSPSFDSIFGFHNEHKVIFTKLLFLIEYNINGLNFYYHSILNAVFILISVLMLYYILSYSERWQGYNQIWYLPIFFIPYFTRLIYTLYYQDITSVSFMLIFAFLAIYFGFIKTGNVKNYFVMLLFLLLSILSFSFTFALGVVLVYTIKNILLKNKGVQRVEMVILSIVILVIFLFSIYFLYFYFGNKIPTGSVYPTSLIFWKHFIKSVAFSVLLYKVNIVVASIIFVFVVSILLIPLFKERLRNDKSIWVCYAVIGGVLLSIAAISYGRASFEEMIDNRHRLITTAMLPAFVIILVAVYNSYRYMFLKIVIVVYYISLFIFVSTNYLEYRRYFIHSEIRVKEGVECVKAYYNGIGDGNCPAIYPGNISKEKLDMAKQLNFSFTRYIHSR